MAVVEWEETSRSGSTDPQNFRTYTRNFWVRTNDPQDGPIVVSAAIPIYIWQSIYSIPGESDPYALAQSCTVQPRANEHCIWDYSVTYSTRPFDFGAIANPMVGGTPPGLGPSPTLPSAPTPPGGTDPAYRPWSLKIGTDNTQFSPVEDLNGDPIAASNGQRYTGLTIDRAIPYISLALPMASANLGKPGVYTNSVNNDLFFGYLPGTLRCVQYDITSQFEMQWGYFYQIDLKFQISATGWNVRIIDEGNYWATGGHYTRLADKWSNPIDTSVWLDGSGGKNLTGIPVYRDFEVYPLRAFGSIL